MKKGLLRTVAAFMSVCTLCGTSMLTTFAASSTNTIGNIVYYTENGKNTGIKSIKEKNTLYYDCANNENTDVTTEFLMKYLTTPVQYQSPDGQNGTITPLEAWANVASGVFENGGKYTCTDNYNKYYSPNHSTSSTENVDVADKLGNKDSETQGSKKDDNYQSTGLSVTTSLKNLRYAMCKHISDRINRYALDPEDILSQGDNCDDALPEFNDSTNREILYNIVTSISRDGSTCKYKYNSYGLAFFDFDLKIINVPGIDYVQDASKTKHDSSVKESIVNTTKNNSLDDASSQITTEMTKTESISTSVSNSEGYSLSEMYGGSVEITSGVVKGVIQSNLTASQVYESARTQETTTVSSVSQSKSVNCTVPAHTIVNVEQSIAKDSMTTQYDTPVALTYKVAVFSMSGDVYADSAFTLCQSTVGYSQSNFSTFFGGDSSKEGFYAYESLTNKVDNAKVSGFDESYGNNHVYYKYHDGHSTPTDTTEFGLNWEEINNVYKRNTGDTVGIKSFSDKCPMLPAGTTTTTTVESVNTDISSPQPMYNPSSFRVINNDSQKYYIFKDGTFQLSTISIGAFDRFGAPYYDFLMKDGYWSVKEGSEDIIEYDADSYVVKAKGVGTGTLVWKLKDGVEYSSAYDSCKVTNENAKPVEITFTVREYPLKG